jgi:hypothetical protein
MENICALEVRARYRTTRRFGDFPYIRMQSTQESIDLSDVEFLGCCREIKSRKDCKGACPYHHRNQTTKVDEFLIGRRPKFVPQLTRARAPDMVNFNETLLFSNLSTLLQATTQTHALQLQIATNKRSLQTVLYCFRVRIVVSHSTC